MASENSFLEKHPSIEDLKITFSDGGIIKNIPALDIFWVEKRELTLYKNLPHSKQPFGVVEAWKEQAKCVLDDLKWMLSMPHHKFWSNIVYYPPCMDLLVSFLQESNPPYQRLYDDKTVNELNDQIYRKVLIVFSRLVTNKESETEWMNKEYLGKLIYDKYIFTIPTIWDLCLLYGCNNKNVVSKIVSIVFELQKKYNEDLKIAIEFLKQVFSFISYKVDSRTVSDAPVLLEKFTGFSGTFGGLQEKKNENGELSLTVLKDFALHLLDSVITIRTLLEIHLPAREILKELNFYNSIVNMYETTLPLMYEKVSNSKHPQAEIDEVFTLLDNSRVEMLDIFRMILETSINLIMSGSLEVEQAVNSYLLIITDCISEKIFIRDYNKLYPIDIDLDILCSAYPKMDPLKCDFILQAIRSVNEESFENEFPNFDDELIEDVSPPPSNHIDSTTTTVEASNISEEIKLQSLISEVKDILPHLGDGFISKCLEFYGNDSEMVINSILENHLDESLQKLDPSLPIIPEDPLDEQFLKTGIDRLNIYDNDEFDIMSKDNIDTSKIHKGKKKPKHKDLSQMLNDKSHIKEMKDKYAKYSMVSDTIDIYDDEYDDTYDDAEAPNSVVETAVEIERNPNIKYHNTSKSDSEEETPEEVAESSSKLDAFCANPEEIRARYQARREAKYGPSQQNRDVVGRAKGQGQDKEVLLNRQHKAANKSSKANHNRRSGAQWKRNQSMLPS